MRIKSTILALGVLGASAIPAFATNKIIDFEGLANNTDLVDSTGGAGTPTVGGTGGYGSIANESAVFYNTPVKVDTTVGGGGGSASTVTWNTFSPWNATNTTRAAYVTQAGSNKNDRFSHTFTISLPTGGVATGITLNSFDLAWVASTGETAGTPNGVTNLTVNGVALTGTNGFTTGTNATFTAASATFGSVGTPLATNVTSATITFTANFNVAIDNINYTTIVPEPASLGLAAIGGLGLIRRRRA